MENWTCLGLKLTSLNIFVPQFFQEVTLKLLETIKDLRCSEQELREVLKKKEKEIGQYKSLGGKIRYSKYRRKRSIWFFKKLIKLTNFFH